MSTDLATSHPPVACHPSAIPALERLAHFTLARELFHNRAQEYRALPDGYAVRFCGDDFDRVARFVTNERKCCPFMSFEVSVSANSGPLWLRMTGPDGTRAILEAELGLNSADSSDPPCQCASESEHAARTVRLTTAGGLLAALGLCASCCLLPFLLASLGVAGAWVGKLNAFAAYKWLFVALSAGMIGYGFYTTRN